MFCPPSSDGLAQTYTGTGDLAERGKKRALKWANHRSELRAAHYDGSMFAANYGDRALFVISKKFASIWQSDLFSTHDMTLQGNE